MIAVIGSGSWGTALAMLLAINTKEKILLWGINKATLNEIASNNTNERYLPGIKLPLDVQPCYDIKDLCSSALDIVIAVPSKGFAEVLKLIKPYLNERHRIIWATKGLDPFQNCLLHTSFENLFDNQLTYAILAGPSFAREVANRQPTSVVIASKDSIFANDLYSYFNNANFSVHLSTDIIGVQIGGIMKNVIAIAAGISDGLQFGANARANLITNGFNEMLRLGLCLGSEINTLQGLAGLGDLILTCTDNKSRNRRFGIALANGKTIEEAKHEVGQIVEAIDNSSGICQIAETYKLRIETAQEVSKVLCGVISSRNAVVNLFNYYAQVQ